MMAYTDEAGQGMRFRQADYVRAVKAAKAAELEIHRTEIHPDGRIVLVHRTEPLGERRETVDEWWAKNMPGQ
ncbi:hypothetical protein ACLNGM_20335 [Aureimonas phyllosphaerae]|uniref:hypothetical protein n=1 Tax=Aureimonas phyllosphaerae TaxID=1166078 RepID=UPI003A5BDB55